MIKAKLHGDALIAKSVRLLLFGVLDHRVLAFGVKSAFGVYPSLCPAEHHLGVGMTATVE